MKESKDKSAQITSQKSYYSWGICIIYLDSSKYSHVYA